MESDSIAVSAVVVTEDSFGFDAKLDNVGDGDNLSNGDVDDQKEITGFKSPWNKPVFDEKGIEVPVMGAKSWPALAEAWPKKIDSSTTTTAVIKPIPDASATAHRPSQV